MRIVKNLFCFYLVLISCVYTQEVFLSITNLDATGLEITMSNFEEVGGFQFDIDVGDGLDSLNVTGASGGTAANAGFTVSTNSTGLVLGFSFSGASIPIDSTGSPLVYVDLSFTGEEGSFSISSATISDPSGGSIDVSTGEDYIISGSTGCTDESACNYDDSATSDDGSCLENDCAGECGGAAIIDECGMCDGPGAVYECGCSDIPEDDCDCEGNVLDDCGECGGDGSTCVDLHYNVEIAGTGESTLFIFETIIEGLESGDELGVFDANGVIDTLGNTGEILVGAGTWTGAQLEVVGIGAVDVSEFGGPILPGAVDGNTMSLKVWKDSEEMEYNVTYTTSAGIGLFNGLFTAINSILFVPPCEDDDSAVAPFTCEDFLPGGSMEGLGCDGMWGDVFVSDVCPETCDTCPVYGCTDETACNYDSEATDDDGSCEYVVDCSGECGGDAAVDDCGVCDGGNADQDCAGVCFGDSFIDDCGYCVEAGTNPDDCLDADNGLPTEFSLSQNYPNPFNPSTNISFDVAEPGNIDILVYDILGNYVSTLISGFYSEGKYTVNWTGNDASGNSVASGIYIYQLIHDKVTITKKMTLLR